MNWRDQAACRGYPINMFFPRRGATAQTAACRAICAKCPVLGDCATWALSDPELFGFAGGLSHRERAQLRGRYAKAPRQLTPEHLARVISDHLASIGWKAPA